MGFNLGFKGLKVFLSEMWSILEEYPLVELLLEENSG